MYLPIPQIAVSTTPAETGAPFAGDVAGKCKRLRPWSQIAAARSRMLLESLHRIWAQLNMFRWHRRFTADTTAKNSFETQTILVLRDDGELFVADAIDYEGKLWLVPEWIPGPELRCERPTRLICLDALQVVEADARHQADLELVPSLAKKFS